MNLVGAEIFTFDELVQLIPDSIHDYIVIFVASADGYLYHVFHKDGG